MNYTGLPYLRGIDRTLRVSAIGALLLALIWMMGDILLIIFAAVLIACVLHGAGDRVHRWTGISSGWSLFAVIAAMLLAACFVVWWRGPNLADQADQLTDQLTTQLPSLWERLEQHAWEPRIVDYLRRTAQSTIRFLTGQLPGLAGSLLGIGGTVIVVAATGVFLAASPGTYVNGGLRLLPRQSRRRGREVIDELGKTLQLWFVGQLLDMTVVTLLSGAGLLILGVPLAPTLALFAGLLNFVPYVGALAGAVPALVVAFAQWPALALSVAVLFACVQMLEGNLIAPLIQKRTVSLPPALTILSQTILGTVFGPLGLILATPLMAALLVAVRMIYVESFVEGEESDI